MGAAFELLDRSGAVAICFRVDDDIRPPAYQNLINVRTQNSLTDQFVHFSVSDNFLQAET